MVEIVHGDMSGRGVLWHIQHAKLNPIRRLASMGNLKLAIP